MARSLQLEFTMLPDTHRHPGSYKKARPEGRAWNSLCGRSELDAEAELVATRGLPVGGAAGVGVVAVGVGAAID